MIALLRTTDPIKLSSVRALLDDAGVETQTFDAAAGGLWPSVIPVRLMVSDTDVDRARRLLREAGFAEAKDGDWDLTSPR